MSPTSSSPSKTRRRRVSVISPIWVARTSQRSHTSISSGRRAGSTTHSIRSCDSEIMISNGSMSASRSGTRETSMSSPASPFDAISEELDDSRAEVLERGEQVTLQQLEAALDQLRLLERIADLDGGTLRVVFLRELGAGEYRGAADPVATGTRPEQHQLVADPGRGAADQPLARSEPDAHRVHEAVLLVRLLEVDLAADRRNPDRVAVVANALHGPVEQVARAGRVELAEAERVQYGDRPRPHRKNVPQDPAHARGRALERLHVARVVVRLDLERCRQAVADVDHARVLARPHQDVRTLGRQQPQQLLRVLVRAVLRPHQREHRQLERVRLAPHALADAVVFRVGQAELPVRSSDQAHAGTIASDSNSLPPSADPVSGSTACSGCGMSPITFPPTLHTPATSSIDPFGLCPGA